MRPVFTSDSEQLPRHGEHYLPPVAPLRRRARSLRHLPTRLRVDVAAAHTGHPRAHECVAAAVVSGVRTDHGFIGHHSRSVLICVDLYLHELILHELILH